LFPCLVFVQTCSSFICYHTISIWNTITGNKYHGSSDNLAQFDNLLETYTPSDHITITILPVYTYTHWLYKYV